MNYKLNEVFETANDRDIDTQRAVDRSHQANWRRKCRLKEEMARPEECRRRRHIKGTCVAPIWQEAKMPSTCQIVVTYVLRCMPGELTSGFLLSRWRGNVARIPAACATRNFTFLVRDPCVLSVEMGVYHYSDVIMDAMASETTSLTVVYLTVYTGVDQRKHQSSASPAFLLGIHHRLRSSLSLVLSHIVWSPVLELYEHLIGYIQAGP